MSKLSAYALSIFSSEEAKYLNQMDDAGIALTDAVEREASLHASTCVVNSVERLFEKARALGIITEDPSVLGHEADNIREAQKQHPGADQDEIAHHASVLAYLKRQRRIKELLEPVFDDVVDAALSASKDTSSKSSNVVVDAASAVSKDTTSQSIDDVVDAAHKQPKQGPSP